MPILQSISAVKTDFARTLDARGAAESVLLGDWSFQIGTSGYDTLDPNLAMDVDSTLQALLAPTGGQRFLGRVTVSGFGASVALTATPGIVQVNGLTGIPNSAARRWLRIFGSGSATINGTWFISQWLSATSVLVHNPLATASDAGPLSYELREACVMRPNPQAVDFHGRVLETEANGLQLGEVGIFCRVLRAPVTEPGLLGTAVLYANAHHPALSKFPEMVVNYHACCQF